MAANPAAQATRGGQAADDLAGVVDDHVKDLPESVLRSLFEHSALLRAGGSPRHRYVWRVGGHVSCCGYLAYVDYSKYSVAELGAWSHLPQWAPPAGVLWGLPKRRA